MFTLTTRMSEAGTAFANLLPGGFPLMAFVQQIEEIVTAAYTLWRGRPRRLAAESDRESAGRSPLETP